MRADPDGRGLSEEWPSRDLPPDAIEAPVPGVWNTVIPGYTGAAFYETTFGAPLGRIGRVARLVCGGANYLADAWLNGVHLGQHEGGYTPFALRCERALRDGANRLVLRIVDPPAEGQIDGLSLAETPTAKESWYGGVGGPWGGVSLELVDPVWIEHVVLRWDEPAGSVLVRIEVGSDYDERRDAMVAVEFQGPNAERVRAGPFSFSVRPGGNSVEARVTIPRPLLWAPEHPVLYRWRVTVNGSRHHRDELSGDFGLRNCALRDGQLFVNGVPRYVKGVLLQPTYPHGFIGPPDGLVTRDLELAQSAGFNLIRCHLRPPPPGFLTEADRRGMLVYEETPLAWIAPSARLLEHGRREVRQMVRRDGNHPSVVLWGLFNENARAADLAGDALLAELARLDPTRPIIENSGGAAVGEAGAWAWAGQTRGRSPGDDVPSPLDDVHVYLASPVRRAARSILESVGSERTLDVTPGRPSPDRIATHLAGGRVLVSEYGCGGLPDFDAELSRFGDEQHLTDAHVLRGFRDDLERGLGRRGLDCELGDLGTLARLTQATQARGVAAQTAALRRNSAVAGYVLTQLADAGWEQMAGIAGLWRKPRPAHAAMARLNRPRCLWVEPTDPCSTGRVRIRAWLLQDPGLSAPATEGSLTLSVHAEAPDNDVQGNRQSPGSMPPRGAKQCTAERLRAVALDAGTTELGAVTLTLPAIPGPYVVRASLTAGDWQDAADCTVFRLPDAGPMDQSGIGNPTGRSPGSILVDGRRALDAPTLERLRTRARAGAHLCLTGLTLETAALVAGVFGLPLVAHGARGNFMGTYHYVRQHPLFAGLGAPRLADEPFAEVLPTWALEELPDAEVLAGCFALPDGGPGFVWRATVQTLGYGRGRLTFYQLNLGRPGGAFGRYLLARLVAWLADAEA